MKTVGKQSQVFTVFICFPTVFTTVFNGFHSFHMFCNILRRLLASATHARHAPSNGAPLSVHTYVLHAAACGGGGIETGIGAAPSPTTPPTPPEGE